MKIFWSWQSDTPGKISRHLIRSALDQAVLRLKATAPIDESLRDSLHIDQDRQGVTGSPDLFNTIKEKISAAQVFVADVTPIAVTRATDDGLPAKQVMNPNVAIELGYALHVLTERRVLMVFNTYYGDRKTLPFDLAHFAGPIAYCLAPDASKAEIDAQKRYLSESLSTALRAFIKPIAVTLPAEARRPFEAMASGASSALWFQLGDVLATQQVSADKVGTRYQFADSAGIYLRIMPAFALKRELSTGTILEAAQRKGVGMLDLGSIENTYRNPFGAIRIAYLAPDVNKLLAATQIFKSGEVWCLSRKLLRWDKNGRGISVPVLHTALRRAMSRNAELLQTLGIEPPYNLVFGGNGVLDYKLRQGSFDEWEVLHDDEFKVPDLVLSSVDQSELNKLADAMIDAAYEVTGRPRPQPN